MKTRLNALLALLLSFVPSALPTAPAAFDAWYEAIITLGGYPNNDSTRNALAAMLQSSAIGAQTTRVPKRFFVLTMRKAISMQLAFQVINDIRLKRKDERQRLQEASTAVVQEISS
jgi:hypothetical protein